MVNMSFPEILLLVIKDIQLTSSTLSHLETLQHPLSFAYVVLPWTDSRTNFFLAHPLLVAGYFQWVVSLDVLPCSGCLYCCSYEINFDG